MEAGAFLYYTGWYTIDRWGFCDAYIAHVRPRGANGEKFDAEHVLATRPTFIQTNAYLSIVRHNYAIARR